MKSKHFPKFVIPVVILVLAVAIYFLVTALSSKETGSLDVSGTIEAQSSVIAPEIGGKVTAVNVNEGDSVTAGDILFTIDDTLLQAQRGVAEAALVLAKGAAATAQAAADAAQANLDLALAAAKAESTALRAADWATGNPQGYTLAGGSFTPADLISAAQAEVDAAAAGRSEAEAALLVLLADTANLDFAKAESDLLANRAEAQAAADVLSKANTSANTDLKDAAQSAYDDVLTRLEDAQKAYDDLVETDAAVKILEARLDMVLAVERMQAAQSRLSVLQTGENSLKVKAAQAVLNQAAAASDQAQGAVQQAQANLDLLDAQLSKLSIAAPFDGVVLGRSVEIGEVLSPAAPAFTLGQLDPFTITVYVPETEVGLLSINQMAQLSVDSYPGETFSAVIIHIADQAEFTPRNVQTAEGRKTTVFAVKLQISNPDDKLKPGMPADVSFNK
ncbi:MAG: HlyD family secretion protein [Anaerolineaceae bacterium]